MTSLPIWSRDAELPRWDPIAQDRHEEIVIVGAGLAGLGLARTLRALGADPLVVDAHGPASGASGRNAGFVLRTHVTEYPRLRARVGAELASVLLATAAENHSRIARLLGNDAYRASGSLMLASGDSEASALDEARRALASDGVHVRDVTVPSALAGFDAALRVDDDGEVHPGRLAAALAHGTRGAILDVHSADATSVTGAHRIDADVVVLATNAWTAKLVPSLGHVITPQRAQMLATEPLARSLDTPCYAGLGFDYFRQRTDGRVLLGGRRHLFLDAERTDVAETSSEVQQALDVYLATHLPFARDARIDARWSGIMAFTPDGLPLAGRVAGRRERTPSPWVLAGWTGHGLGLALGVGAHLADAIIDSEYWSPRVDPLLSALDPARFSGTVARP